jgi:hypothetical protein
MATTDTEPASLRKPPRRGSFIVRIVLRRIPLLQDPRALKAAARMVLVLPLIQSLLLVGILDAELWMLLLGLEGLMIAWLAASQLGRANPESRLIGFGLAVLNVGLLAAAGLFLGSHVYWATGVIALLPIGVLVFRTTRPRTVLLAWLGYALPLLLLLLFAVAGRAALIKSETEQDAAARSGQLQLAWYAMRLRGANGAERALLRLRQAQAAFEAQDYAAAYQFADDGLFDRYRELRAIPASLIGEGLIESLIRLKAQAYYNQRWEKQGEIPTPISPEPLQPELLSDPQAPVRWGW